MHPRSPLCLPLRPRSAPSLDSVGAGFLTCLPFQPLPLASRPVLPPGHAAGRSGQDQTQCPPWHSPSHSILNLPQSRLLLGGPRGTSDLMASLQVCEPSRGPRCAAPTHSTGPPRLLHQTPPCAHRLAPMSSLCTPAASARSLVHGAHASLGLCGAHPWSSSPCFSPCRVSAERTPSQGPCPHANAPPPACANETPHQLPSLSECHPLLFTYLSPRGSGRQGHSPCSWLEREASVHRMPFQGCV